MLSFSTINTNSIDTDHLADFCSNAVTKLAKGTQSFFRNICYIKDDSFAYAHLWKFIPSFLVSLSSIDGSLLNSRTNRAILFLSPFMLLGDIADILNGRFSEMPWLEIARRVCLSISNIGGTIFFVGHLGFAALSTSPVLPATILVSAGIFGGIGISVVSAINTLSTLEDREFKKEITVKALLDITAAVFGVALPIITIVGIVINPWIMSGLIILSSGLTILSFCYEKSHKEAFVDVLAAKGRGKNGIFKDISLLMSNLDALKKVLKFVRKIIGAITTSTFLTAFSNEAKCFIEFHDILNLPKRIKEWICPDELSRKFFWQLPETTLWKVANKIFLTVLAFISAMGFAFRHGLISDGVDPSELGILIALAAASLCAYIDQAVNLNREYHPDGPKTIRIKADEKLHKWVMLYMTINDHRSQNDIKVSLFKRAKKLNVCLSDLSFDVTNLSKFSELKIEKLKTRQNNAAIRCHKCGLGMITSIAKLMGGICSILAIGMSITALTTGIGLFSIIAGIIGMYSLGYDAKNRIRAEPNINKNSLPQAI